MRVMLPQYNGPLLSNNVMGSVQCELYTFKNLLFDFKLNQKKNHIPKPASWVQVPTLTMKKKKEKKLLT